MIPVRAPRSDDDVDGADPSMLGTVERTDRAQQVRYNDHPLYRYDGDHGRGDHHGHCRDEYGGDWRALDGDGNWYGDENCQRGGGD